MLIVEQLARLFHPGEPPPEDPQAYREALVDLLVWTMEARVMCSNAPWRRIHA